MPTSLKVTIEGSARSNERSGSGRARRRVTAASLRPKCCPPSLFEDRAHARGRQGRSSSGALHLDCLARGRELNCGKGGRKKGELWSYGPGGGAFVSGAGQPRCVDCRSAAAVSRSYRPPKRIEESPADRGGGRALDGRRTSRRAAPRNPPCGRSSPHTPRRPSGAPRDHRPAATRPAIGAGAPRRARSPHRQPQRVSASARRPNARSQPRTVPGGRSSSAAIVR